jgi:hypothetical protein
MSSHLFYYFDLTVSVKLLNMLSQRWGNAHHCSKSMRRNSLVTHNWSEYIPWRHRRNSGWCHNGWDWEIWSEVVKVRLDRLNKRIAPSGATIIDHLDTALSAKEKQFMEMIVHRFRVSFSVCVKEITNIALQHTMIYLDCANPPKCRWRFHQRRF